MKPFEPTQAMRDAMRDLPFTVPVDSQIPFNLQGFESPERIEVLAEILMKGSASLFLLQKRHDLTASLFATIGPDNLPKNTIVTSTLLQCNERSKTMFFNFLRAFGEKVQAVAIAFTSEEWVYAGDDLEGFRAHKRANGGSFEGFPGVQEQLGVHIEHKNQTYRWGAPILRSGSAVRLAAWKKQPLGKATGKMIGILRP